MKYELFIVLVQWQQRNRLLKSTNTLGLAGINVLSIVFSVMQCYILWLRLVYSVTISADFGYCHLLVTLEAFPEAVLARDSLRLYQSETCTVRVRVNSANSWVTRTQNNYNAMTKSGRIFAPKSVICSSAIFVQTVGSL